jgi:hypothetical protein
VELLHKYIKAASIVNKKKKKIGAASSVLCNSLCEDFLKAAETRLGAAEKQGRSRALICRPSKSVVAKVFFLIKSLSTIW